MLPEVALYFLDGLKFCQFKNILEFFEVDIRLSSKRDLNSLVP